MDVLLFFFLMVGQLVSRSVRESVHCSLSQLGSSSLTTDFASPKLPCGLDRDWTSGLWFTILGLVHCFLVSYPVLLWRPRGPACNQCVAQIRVMCGR